MGNTVSEIIDPTFHICLHEPVVPLCHHMPNPPMVARQQNVYGDVTGELRWRKA